MLTNSPPKQILTQVLIKNESCRSAGAVESLWKALVGSAAPPFLFMQVSGGLPVYGTDLWTPPKPQSFYCALWCEISTPTNRTCASDHTHPSEVPLHSLLLPLTTAQLLGPSDNPQVPAGGQLPEDTARVRAGRADRASSRQSLLIFHTNFGLFHM